MNLNKVFLSGRLTRDPQLRYTPSGTAVADIGLAVNRYFNDASGQRREETCFVDVVLWARQAEVCHKHLRKGSPIFIEGRLSFETWEGQGGQRRSRLKVVADSFQFVGQAQDRVPSDVPEPPRTDGPARMGGEEVAYEEPQEVRTDPQEVRTDPQDEVPF